MIKSYHRSAFLLTVAYTKPTKATPTKYQVTKVKKICNSGLLTTSNIRLPPMCSFNPPLVWLPPCNPVTQAANDAITIGMLELNGLGHSSPMFCVLIILPFNSVSCVESDIELVGWRLYFLVVIGRMVFGVQ